MRCSRERGQQLDGVVEFEVDDEALVERISGRFACAAAAPAITTASSRPRSPGVCDVCGSTEFVRRKDDNAETVRARLEAYHAADRAAVALLSRRGACC